jgi:hypothetical protein
MGAALVLGSLTFITENFGGAVFFIFVGIMLIAMANYFYQAQRGNIETGIGYTIKNKK